MTSPDELDALRALLDARLPVALHGGSLELTGPVEQEDPRWLAFTLRLVTRDDDMIVDVREQQISLGPLDAHPFARWLAFVDATLRSAAAIVAAFGGPDAALPGDVFAHRRLLDDPALQSADDFAAKLGDPAWLAAANEAFELELWREELDAVGLADHVAEVQALLLPSVRLQLLARDEADEDDEVDDDEVRSRFGGAPDLPPDLAWPSEGGEPLTFVAQLDLAALAEFEAADELPREGLLSFFYAPLPPDGWEALHGMAHPVAVLHFPPGTPLERRACPERVEPLRAYELEFDHERMLPMPESCYAFERLRPREQVQAYYESFARAHAEHPPIDYAALANVIVGRSECDFDRPIHRLLGHPSSIQGDPYLDVENCERGWAGWQEGSDAAMATRERALDWRLLLQVDAYQDDELLLEQDGGFFYFFLPADALANHDWSRARGILQCH